jgi:hypothetical protein
MKARKYKYMNYSLCLHSIELKMNKFNKNDVHILDLPDEILLIIFEKLPIIDVLSSIVNVNSRFFRLATDPLHVHDLDMTIKSLNGQISPNDIQALSRICQNILPHIHHQVHKLTVEQHSMKEILDAGAYPELHSLSLLNFEESILHEYLTSMIFELENNEIVFFSIIDNSIFRDLLAKQIVHLNIFNIKTTVDDFGRTLAKIFLLILSLCKKLTVLNIGDIFPTSKCSFTIAFLRSETWMYSNLIKLKINVPLFHDCLYLLDGRLDSLSTLIVNVNKIHGIAPLTVNIVSLI